MALLALRRPGHERRAPLMHTSSQASRRDEREGSAPAFRRSLTAPGLSLLTLGGVMGSGLFLASGLAIRRSGPAVLLVMGVALLAMTLEIWALGEMSAADPEPGSFLQYAERVYGRGMTFVGGWVFWFSSVLTMSSEVTAAALFTRWFWPGVPLWIWALGYSAAIVLANFVSVRGFGTVEGVMAGVKVVAVAGFLALAALLLGHVVPLASLRAVPAWTGHLARLPLWPVGVGGPLSSLILVLFACAGTGVIGLAAGETRRPPVTIRESLTMAVPLIWLLYLGSLYAIMALTPWRHVATATSPFVQIVHALGLPWLGPLMNVVLIFAVLSTMNAALYSNSRVLYALGRDGLAPRSLARLNRRGIPANGVWWSSALLGVTIALAYFLPKQAYSYLVTATGFQAMFIWAIILLTHLRYRPYLRAKKRLTALRIPAYPWTTYVALAVVGLGMAGAFLAPAERLSLGVAAGFIALVLLAFVALRRHLSAVSEPARMPAKRAGP